MFAGLPGIGVGTLFYVLVALWMPFRELARVAQGTSSVARWKLIVRQVFFASSIILSIMLADRVLMWMLGQNGPRPISPARFLNTQFVARVPQSVLAAPITASIILLGGVLLTVELLRAINAAGKMRRASRIEVGEGFTEMSEGFSNEAVN